MDEIKIKANILSAFAKKKAEDAQEILENLGEEAAQKVERIKEEL